LLKFKGRDIIGVAVKAPLTNLEKIYVLPMWSINTEKTTGVVTSVPSDSPDDYAALRDVKTKEATQKEFGITPEMVRYWFFKTLSSRPRTPPQCCPNGLTEVRSHFDAITQGARCIFTSFLSIFISTIRSCNSDQLCVSSQN